MTLRLYFDAATTDPISEGDFSNPDAVDLNGSDGDSRDRQLFIANEQAVLVSALSAAETVLELTAPAFRTGQNIIVNGEQMLVVGGEDGPQISVARGAEPVAHEAGSIAYAAYDYAEVQVVPVDQQGSDERVWFRLAETQEGLDTAVPGAPLLLGRKTHAETKAFWRRVSVPAGTPVQLKTDLRLELTALEHFIETE